MYGHDESHIYKLLNLHGYNKYGWDPSQHRILPITFRQAEKQLITRQCKHCLGNKPIEKQEGLTHRNRLNEVVTCSRWVANERTDSEWIKTGYASREAKNLSSGSKLVRDLDPHKYHQL